MSQKTLIMIGMTVGSIIGEYIPTLLGAGFLSAWAIIGSAIGGFLGIYITYKVTS